MRLRRLEKVVVQRHNMCETPFAKVEETIIGIVIEAGLKTNEQAETCYENKMEVSIAAVSVIEPSKTGLHKIEKRYVLLLITRRIGEELGEEHHQTDFHRVKRNRSKRLRHTYIPDMLQGRALTEIEHQREYRQRLKELLLKFSLLRLRYPYHKRHTATLTREHVDDKRTVAILHTSQYYSPCSYLHNHGKSTNLQPFTKISCRKFGRLKENKYLCTRISKRRSLRLSVRTRDFHSLKSSSILLGTTIKG